MSPVGTFETCRRDQKTSALRAKRARSSRAAYCSGAPAKEDEKHQIHCMS